MQGPIPPLLEIDGLTVTFTVNGKPARVVDGVSLRLNGGETVAIVGESGCGKSVTSLAVMGLLPRPIARVTEGRILLRRGTGGVDLASLPPAEYASVRGDDIAMIFQEPMTSLNPLHRIGEQIAEPLRIHRGLSRGEARERACELLERVGISDPRARLDAYPHEMSGGMRQRVMIAMALACDPAVLIADEATTALDVTVQAQILDLLRALQQDSGMGLLFITHDLGVVAEIAERVVVMYAGQVVEEGDVRQILTRPLHPYTRGLIASVPRIDRPMGKDSTFHAIGGRVPEIGRMPPGCRFAPRCEHARPGICDHGQKLEPVAGGRTVRCVRWRELEAMVHA